jgi:hypothetical protein
MKKMFCVLSPLLCSSLLYHQQANGMQLKKTSSDATDTALQNTSIPSQEEVNLAISSIINSNTLESSSIKHVEETNETKAIKNEQPSGFGWTMYLQSFAYSKSSILADALEKNRFQPNNKDHLTLLKESLNECLEQKDDTTILLILSLVNQKHKDVKIDDKSSQDIYKYLNDVRNNKIAILKSATTEKHKTTIANLISLVSTLKEQHLETENKINDLLETNKQESTEKHKLLKEMKKDHREAINCIKSVSACKFPKDTTSVTTGFSHVAQREILKNTKEQVTNNHKELDSLIRLLEVKKDHIPTIENKK